MSEGRPASGGHVGEKKEPVTFKAANVRDAITETPYFIEYYLITMMTPGPSDRKPYVGSRIVAMMQAMIDKTVSKNFNLLI